MPRGRFCGLFVAAALLAIAGAGRGAAASEFTLQVDTDFPGGSADVLKIDQQDRRLRIRPRAPEETGWVVWWYFRLSGIRPGETITLEVGNPPWSTPARAAFSLDNKTWTQTAEGEKTENGMTYRQQVDGREAWFAWGPPFTPEDAKRLVDEAGKTLSCAAAFELCRTRGGRPTPALVIQEPGAEEDDRYGVWIQARQHAWESGSSWVCKGAVDWLTSDDPRAAEFRRRAKIYVVPVMDIDNVAIGAGGKEQKPHDHNRDWSDDPHWPAVAAAIEHIRRENTAGRFDLFLDLHNPSATAREPFFFLAPTELLSKKRRERIDRFLAACQLEMTGPLPFKGQTYESGARYDDAWKKISKNWVTENTREHVVAVTLETPWNSPHSTPEGYMTVGRQLAMAMERYFRESPRE
jgi:hypothetical protein